MNQHTPKCYKCIIRHGCEHLTEGTTKHELPLEGFCYEIVKDLIIATDKIGPASSVIKEIEEGCLNIIPMYLSQYVIYTRSENSYILKMKINSFNNGSFVSVKIYNSDGTITNVDPSNIDFYTIFAKCLRDDPIIRDQINALQMYDHQLCLYIMSFIPRLVYLLKVVVYKGEPSQYGDIPYTLYIKLDNACTACTCKHIIVPKFELLFADSSCESLIRFTHLDPTDFQHSVHDLVDHHQDTYEYLILEFLRIDVFIRFHYRNMLNVNQLLGMIGRSFDLFDMCIMTPVRLANDSSLPIVLIDQETL
uniref:Uncharacterized protein n=1 Tax=viral metagenome TaxID=1070528 RepID=A0A6C0E8P3_9ZZZZ